MAQLKNFTNIDNYEERESLYLDDNNTQENGDSLSKKMPIIVNKFNGNNYKITTNNDSVGETLKLYHQSLPILLPPQQHQPLSPPTSLTSKLSTRGILMQLMMSIFANVSIFATGMGLAFPAISRTSMINATDPIALDEDEFSWFASLNAIFCPIGGLLVSLILDRYGRKVTLYLINIIAIIAWLVMATASATDRNAMFIQILLSRIITGISGGLSSSPCGIYTAEIAHPRLRGRLSILSSLGISIGILTVYILGYFIPTNWRLISGICCIYSVVALILVFFLPETPSWLASKGRFDDAEKSLKLFRGLSRATGSSITPEVKHELEILIDKGRLTTTQSNETIFDKFKQPEFYKPLTIIILFFVFQQFSGLFVLIVYAVKFSLEAGVLIDPFLCAVYIGVTRIVGTLLMGVLMDRLGRRLPAMFSGLAMGACMFGIGGYILSESRSLNWLPVFLILTYIFTSSLGLLTLPFTMMAELYPQRYRGLASGLTISALFITSFVVTKIYPTMVQTMGSVNVFFFYGVVSILSVVFVYFFLPETKGKSLEQIEDIFRKKSRHEYANENIRLTRQKQQEHQQNSNGYKPNA